MTFLKHIGKDGDNKVVIIFRQLPGEDHMCLVVYPDRLQSHLHQSIMNVLESDAGQQAENFGDVLGRNYTVEGHIILNRLHQEGLLKKIQTSRVWITPNNTTRLKLDELNRILDEMKSGEAAIARMAELEASKGLQDPADIARRIRGEPVVSAPTSTPGVLDDSQIANNMRSQAAKMIAEAQGLMAEAARLESEANVMDPQEPKTTPKKTRKKAELAE